MSGSNINEWDELVDIFSHFGEDNLHFTKKLVSLMKTVMLRNVHNIPHNIPNKNCDIYMSPETMKDIRNWYREHTNGK